MGLFRLVFVRLSLAVALGLVAASAWSQVASNYEISMAEIARRNVMARTGLMSEQWRLRSYPGVTATSGAGGSVVVTHPVKGPGPAGVIDVEARVVVPKASLARALMKGLPVIGAGITGYEILSEILEDSRIQPGPGGTILMDPGAPEVPLAKWEIFRTSSPLAGYSGYIYPSEAQACTAALALCNSVSSSSYCVQNNANPCAFTTVRKSDGASTGTLTWSRRSAVVPSCPEGQVTSFWADDWCTTPVDNWEVVDEEAAATRAEPKIAPGTEPEVWRALDGSGQPIEGSIPTVTGPAEIPVSRERTDNPDGSVTIKDTSSPIEYGPIPGPTGGTVPGYRWGEKIDTRVYPPGAEIPPLGAPPTGTPGGTTTTEPGSGGSGLEDLITCGLPWTPPCKINEEGTPTAPADTSQAEAQGIIADLAECLGNPSACLPTLPDLAWSFSLPSNCSAIAMPGFAEDVPSLASIDLCEFQPTIHDLVSLLWAAAGLFGAVRLVSREAFGS